MSTVPSVNATVKTGSGDDYVSIHSDFNLLLDANVDLGDGNNTVMFYGNGAKVNATIKTGYGNDYFYVYGGSIDAGEGNNTINGGYNSKATVKTGSGNDYIEDCSSIDAGEGDNTVHAYYDATVKTGSGDDYISGGSSIDAGEGDNTVSGSGTIKTGSGDDFVSIHSGSIDVGEGNNTVYSYYDATVKAGSGDEFVSIRSGSIDVGDGNNTVYGGSTVKTGSGNDYIEDCSSIDAGEGDNTVHAYYDATVKTGSGDDYISNGGSVDAGDGNNTVSGSGTIKTGSGNDYISGGGSIDAGDGDNSVYSNNHDVTITTGAGDDYISGGSSIDAGDGNNIVYGHGMIKTGDGNNTVYGGYNATVRTGDGDDYISGGSSIDAGKGNDLISLNSAVKNNVIEYRAGDGNDTIWGFNSSSTLSISGGEYVRSTVGNDVIITVEDGSILLKDANGKTLNIDGTEVVDEPVWTLSGKIATYGTPGNTLVTVSGVKSLEGLYLSGNTVTISEAALGTDTVSISSGYSLALAQGVDTIKEDLYGWTTLSSGNVAYLTGGTGSYYSLSSNGKTITYNAAVTGANQVELSGVKGTPTLDNNFVSLTANNFASDVSLVSNAGGFQFVLSGNFNGKSFTGTNSLLGSTVSDTIHNHGQRISINTGAGDDYLYSYADNVTIDAGEGDDYIYNNGSNVLFNYRAGDGNDSINGFNAISTLSISGGTYSTQQSGNDVIVTVGDGKITLASATSLSALNINGEEQTVSTTLTLDNNSAAKQTLPAQIVTADATKRTSATRIVGNALNNSILGGTGKDTLYGGNGADYLEGGKGNDKLYGQASNDTLDGGIGNDYLSGYTGNDSLNGGAGNDTLLGGTGNDTLTGGAGNDLFVYSAGKDVITDYATGDKISINAAVTASSVKGSDATFTIGSNTLTVKDGKGKEVVFIDAQDTERTIVGGTYLSTDSMKSPVTISSWRQVGDASERTTAIKLTGNSLDNTLLGGSGKDTLYGKDGNDYLVGNDGNDKLYGQVGNDTLIGGAGNDTLTGGDGNDLFVFDAGNDFISDYATDDKISVNAEITASSVVGSNATFTIGSNTLTVKNGKGAEIVFLDADGNERTIIGGAFVATNSTSTKNTLASWREVGDASARTSAIYLVGNVLGNTLLGGSGKDSLYGKDGDDFIQGNAGADSLYGQNGDDTLWGGIGNDTLKGGDGDDLFIYSGGNDVITDYASGDKISLGMAVTSASLKGSDAILTTDGGKLTIKNAKDLTLIDSFGTEMTTIIGSATYDNNATTKVTLPSGIEIGDASSRTTAIKITGNSLDNSILGGVGKDSLYGGKGNDYIQGGDGNDKIWGQDGNDTLSGGAGNDSMSGGNGANLFIYEFGKDYITDFSATDTLQIGDGTGTYSTQVSGSDIIVTVGDGSITLKDAASLSAVNILGEEISPIEIYGKSSAAKVTLASGIEVGDASARTAAIRIVGNALDNTIFGGAGKDTLYGKDGNDYISGSTGNDKLYGQNGNDTLWGGSGNDTFTGGAGADTFIYNSGEGKDVISDFSNDDLLQITGTFSATYDSSANTISFKVGSTASAITLKNFTAASFKVNDDSYLISGSKLVTK